MKIVFSILFLLSLCFISSGQNIQMINNESTSFTLGGGSDSVNFIVLENSFAEKKPIFLWCQGSLPVPLYVNFKNDGLWLIGGGVPNFDYEKIQKHYHIVVVSMPNTPLIVNEGAINESYAYVGDSNYKQEISEEFERSDYLENYTNRAIETLAFLENQDWVDTSELIVAGHFQGSKVALDIAFKCKNVSKVGLFGPNIFGRIDQLIRQIRKDVEKKIIMGGSR